MKNIFVFDFDGTLTTRDSMLAIIVYQRGWMGLLWAMLLQLPYILLMFAHLYSNHKTKERLLAYCFGGMTEDELRSFCQEFADKHKTILRGETMSVLREAQKCGEECIVITASPTLWVQPFLPDTTVLGTILEFDPVTHRFTGRFLSRNCYGPEKVTRLLLHLPDITAHRSAYHITAYGDSRGDLEMFEYSDTHHLIR